LAELLASAAMYYNSNRSEMSFGERQEFIDDIEELARRHDALATADPAGLIAAMRDANEALYQFAQAPERNQGTVQALIAAMSTFAARVRTAAEAIRQLRGEEE
jgi:hypothetical protein